ncbi:MAG: hypothetical protein R8K49_05225 [Mariprofundaceae bacterium]
MRAHIYIGILPALCMASCATISPPTTLSNGQYMLSINSPASIQGSQALLKKNMDAADEFCAAKDARAKIVHSLVTGTEMFAPQHNQIIFECILNPYSFKAIEPTTEVQNNLSSDEMTAELPSSEPAPIAESIPEIEDEPSLWDQLKTAVQSLGQ